MYPLTKQTWCKGHFKRTESNGHMQMCLTFIIFGQDYAYLKGVFTHKTAQEHDLVIQIIKELFPERAHSQSIVSFNDHPDTTYEDVEKVYREYQRRVEFLPDLG